MGLSTNTYTYAGGAQTFVVNFSLGFIDRDDVEVRVNNAVDGSGDPVFSAYTWIDDSNITVTDPLTVGDKVTVQRTVSKSDLQVDFAEGADITPLNLNLIALQGLMVYQELVDGRIEGAESPSDAADRADAAAAAAELSQIAAAASELAASLSASAAASSATAAASSEAQALAHKDDAQDSKNAAAASAVSAADSADAAADAVESVTTSNAIRYAIALG